MIESGLIGTDVGAARPACGMGSLQSDGCLVTTPDQFVLASLLLGHDLAHQFIARLLLSGALLPGLRRVPRARFGCLATERLQRPLDLLQVIQEQWAEPSSGSEQDWWSHRKDFMGQIASAVMERLVKGQNLKALELVRALQAALNEKHILIYLTDPQPASLLRERNWDGALTISALPSDALLVVDSNVGFNKVDAVIARSIAPS